VTHSPDRSGPHLQAALIAERVLQEQDGVITPVRVIDRVMIPILPGGERPAPEKLFLLVTLKSGGARGSYTVQVKLESPVGTEIPFIPPGTVFLEGEERGVALIVPFAFTPEEQGLYWFDVYFENERLTRVPLRAIFQRVQPPPAVGSP
jgi:hypothetical protein